MTAEQNIFHDFLVENDIPNPRRIVCTLLNSREIMNKWDEQVGDYPSQTLEYYIRNKFNTPDEILALINLINEMDKLSPRERYIRLFTKSLNKTLNNEVKSREIAVAIEKSCYDEIITICKNMTDPPVRKWDNLPFCNIYYSKCRIINLHLDKNSSTQSEFGPKLLTKILSGEISPDNVGTLSEKIFCPEACQEEKQTIDLRSRQTIKYKTSTLYRCPGCHKNETTYVPIQLRAADEGTDYECTCVNCGKVFIGRK